MDPTTGKAYRKFKHNWESNSVLVGTHKDKWLHCCIELFKNIILVILWNGYVEEWCRALLLLIKGLATLASFGSCWKRRTSGSTPDLLNQNLHFNKLPQVIHSYSRVRYWFRGPFWKQGFGFSNFHVAFILSN